MFWRNLYRGLLNISSVDLYAATTLVVCLRMVSDGYCVVCLYDLESVRCTKHWVM